MSQDNVEVVGRAIAAINARDVSAYIDLSHPDLELVMPTAPLEGTLRGKAGIQEFFSSLEQAASVFRFDVETLQAVESDRVLALVRLTFVSDRGVPLTQRLANVYELKGGRLRRVHVYLDRDEALAAVGLQQ